MNKAETKIIPTPKTICDDPKFNFRNKKREYWSAYNYWIALHGFISEEQAKQAMGLIKPSGILTEEDYVKFET